MKKIFIKYREFENGLIKEKQVRGKIIQENEIYFIAEYTINGKKETRAIPIEDVHYSPHVIEYGA